MIDDFLKSQKISWKAILGIVRVGKRIASKGPSRSSVNSMLALQEISILIATLVPKSISLNMLRFLTTPLMGDDSRAISGGIDMGSYEG